MKMQGENLAENYNGDDGEVAQTSETSDDEAVRNRGSQSDNGDVEQGDGFDKKSEERRMKETAKESQEECDNKGNLSNSEKGPVRKEVPRVTMKPPDGGWGWMVTLGSFFNTMIIMSLPPCFGLLFAPFLLDLGSSSTTTAWIFNIQMCIWHLVAPFVRPLAMEFGWRRIGFVGSVLVSSSIILSAFAPSPEFLFFSFSLINGIGAGLAGSIGLLVLPTYFERRRGLANGILMSGISVGQIVCVPFIRFLLEEYAFTGATMIFGAFTLNCIVGTALIQPLKWHMKKVEDVESNIALLAPSDEAKEREKETLTEDIKTQARLRRAEKLARCSETSHTSRGSLASSFLHVSLIDILRETEPVEESGNEKVNPNLEKKKSSSLLVVMKRVFLSTISDLRIFRSPRALIINVAVALNINAYLNFLTMAPFEMRQAGFSLQDTALCISSLGICNLVTRLIVSPLTDWPKFNMKVCFLTGYAIISISIFVFPMATQLTWKALIMAVSGCGVAANITLNNLIMIKYMGLENLAPMFGSSCLLLGGSLIVIGPFIGFVRDISGSYTLSMWVLSGMPAFGLFLWLFMPLAVAYDAKQDTKSSKDKESSKA